MKLGIQDFIVGPLYFLFLLFIGLNIKNKIQDKQVAKYFFQGLTLKMIGAFGITIIYFVYYGGSGDTVYYFRRATFVDEVLFRDFFVGLKILFANPAVYDPETYAFFKGVRAFDMSSFIIVRMVSITNIFCFNSYLANSLVFSALSYIGIWKLFKMFKEIFPNKTKIIAISFLFIPSMFFWGSGILKDNVTLGFLGLLISSFYSFFFKKKSFAINLVYMAISIVVIGTIKSYILLALIPSIFAWLFFQFKNSIKSPVFSTLSVPVLLILLIPLGYGVLQLMSSSFSKFSLDNAQEKAEDMQRWHTYRVEVLKGGDGSSYNLGHVEFTPVGIVTKIPQAINVSIFRPYLWEVRNPIMLLSALESFFLLLSTISAVFLFIRSPGVGFDYLKQHSVLYFMLVFSLIFAFSVGFTSFNFGALSRYRIPLLPFYLCAVLLIRDHLKNYKVTP